MFHFHQSYSIGRLLQICQGFTFFRKELLRVLVVLVLIPNSEDDVQTVRVKATGP